MNELVGLQDQVDLQHGSALEIPHPDQKFDIVWTDHVQMNIADKRLFYSEIARVLKPGGRLLFHDIFKGKGDSVIYPVPWAEDDSISSLVMEKEARSTIEKAGLDIEQWHGRVQESIAFFKKVSARIENQGLPPVGIHLLMGDNAKIKLHNLARNLEEERVTVAMGMAVKV